MMIEVLKSKLHCVRVTEANLNYMGSITIDEDLMDAANMIAMFFFGKYMTYLFISPSETEVINVAVTYFHTVFWFYPFLGSIFLYRNTLQGMGYGLIPMIGGIFELVARTAIVTLVAGKTSFAGVCMADPAAWLAALVPLLPYYFYIMRKWKNSDLLNWQN